MPGKWCMAMLAALIGVFAVAAEDPWIRKLSVDVEIASIPEVQFRSVSSIFPSKNPIPAKWLMVKVEYTPDTVSSFAPKYRPRKGGGSVEYPGWLADVKLEIRVLADIGIVGRDKYPIRALFTGSTTLALVKRDGGVHMAAMFLPARLLERYCAPGLGARGGIRKNCFQVEAVMSVAGRVLARGYSHVPGNGPEEKLTAFEKSAKRVLPDLILENSLLPRSRSPWALMAPDRFDLEKEETAGAHR